MPSDSRCDPNDCEVDDERDRRDWRPDFSDERDADEPRLDERRRDEEPPDDERTDEDRREDRALRSRCSFASFSAALPRELWEGGRRRDRRGCSSVGVSTRGGATAGGVMTSARTAAGSLTAGCSTVPATSTTSTAAGTLAGTPDRRTRRRGVVPGRSVRKAGPDIVAR